MFDIVHNVQFEHLGKKPQVHESTRIAPNAVICSAAVVAHGVSPAEVAA
jgi:carbonic anhydrase/acetyltransferase-like protein (isoleucine patch superfamily)